MNELKGACIIGQSGGPTAVINASALGVIRTALDNGNITRVLGAAHGIKGVLEDRLYDMGQEDAAELDLLKYTPSSELGSCRYKLADPDKDDTDYKRILEIFKKYDVRYFFYNGGNDSMDTCNKISKYMQKSGYECRIIGVPKTIDNDLNGTDHCPGFASAAKFIATSCMEVHRDAHVYDTGMITIVEIMGRHAGWLAGSAALATWAGYGPDLIYLPEVDFDMDRFIADVQAIYNKTGKCMIAVSEGIHYADGSFVSEAKTSATDGFGHAQLGGLAAMLAEVVKSKTGAKVRGIELSLLQRCGSHVASKTDIEEAFAAGKAAVEAAVSGVTDKMVAFKCSREGGYHCETVLEPLDIVANFEKKVPREWINAAGNGIEQPFIDYVLPLIQGEANGPKENSLPRFAKLKKVLTTSM
ncbi:6-phosphofructokinase [Pseudoflavonifractor sp. DSM 107456]|uniref:Pyrophosphate--fructose 6-phosphate 1-phosphotransferase n=2 Tax=Pseudoflavonifractor TaxID=1017280 RepID=A0ABR9R9E1_9FIRM|nr:MULTISPECIES: 6-phosphofructokinase [Eubacteriales]MBC5731083.1 6-phosphofructokinase [Pseudoflavonifractor hominis]MBE5055305.1 6-phosphofructokinase [Pseudoflavonifractor gallinarum]MBS5135134.1 6-phosphofructokinase [Oscillospiraceae bacterium]MBT9684905.1 diphosphate--fructose-6-phosphate 1-phosphotransferase [Pseudoflavonifractor sp. MCC625]